MSSPKNLNTRSPRDLSSMRVIDLKRELRNKGLPVSGRKNELLARLRAALASPPCTGTQLRAMSATTDSAPVVAVEEAAPGEGEAVGYEADGEERARGGDSSGEGDDDGRGGTQEMENNQNQDMPLMWSPPALRASPKRSLFDDDNQDDQSGVCEGSSVCDGSAGFTTPNRVLEPQTTRPPSALRSSCTPRKEARISFGQVEIRKYRVSHGGATSTPSKGAYPIGLSWEVAEEESKPLDNYEKEAIRFASPRRLSEKERKRLLEKVDARTYFEKQASFETEKEELKQLRRARANIGCHCTSPSSCGTSRCICFKEDMACNDDSCRCTCDNCVNPKRDKFDQERIDSYRRRRILEAPYAAGGVGAVTVIL